MKQAIRSGLVSGLLKKMVECITKPVIEFLDDSLNRQAAIRPSDIEFASSNPNIEAISDDPHSGKIFILPDGFESRPRQCRHPHNRL